MGNLTHEFEFKLQVSPARVFAALSQASELKAWFAEHVEVELKPGGAFRFWGKHTYGAPTRAQATQRLIRYEEPSALAFSWTIHEQRSEVSLAVQADPQAADGCIIKGKHEFATAPSIGRAKEMVDDLWRLHIGNLMAHFNDGQGLLLPDYSDAQPQIQLSILIDAPRERVFKAMLDPQLLNQWIASAAQVEPKVGGRYSYGWKFGNVDGGPTRILEMVQNEKLVTDWPDWRGDTSVPVQKITWLLESVGQRTRVTMIHSGFVRAVDISDYPQGWTFFLGRLRLVAQGEPVPAQSEC